MQVVSACAIQTTSAPFNLVIFSTYFSHIPWEHILGSFYHDGLLLVSLTNRS